jgi:hypothetical protein
MTVRVHNTETFSLNEVWKAVKAHNPTTTGDLADCFVKAKSEYFDPKYNNDRYAPANSLLRFRNYGTHQLE